jgi:hypothetical protein
VYTLDATRCVILHLAATQSLEHALGDAAPPLWQCGLIVLGIAAVASQIRALSELSSFFLLGTSAQVGGFLGDTGGRGGQGRLPAAGAKMSCFRPPEHPTLNPPTHRTPTPPPSSSASASSSTSSSLSPTPRRSTRSS